MQKNPVSRYEPPLYIHNSLYHIAIKVQATEIIVNGLNFENDELLIFNFFTMRILNVTKLDFKSLNDLLCKQFNGYFEQTNHEQNTRNNEHCLRLPKVKLEIPKGGY